MSMQRPNDLLPLPLIDFSILIVLSHRRICHGYVIWQDIRERKLMPHAQLGSAQLYNTLNKLRSQGILEKVVTQPGREAIDPRRQYYTITPFGSAVFNAEVARLEALIQHTRA